MSGGTLSTRHVLGISELTRADVEAILRTARALREVMRRPIKKVPTLRGRLVVNLFFEPSTRTRTSFEIAGKMLSADVVNFSASSSSLGKGETLLDTARNLEAMRPDILVVRSRSAGVPWQVARCVRAAVINAGDGQHEHPSQALLDVFTLLDHWADLEGRQIALVGDIAHSRVAGSHLRLLPMLGAKLRLCGPPTMIPRGVDRLGPGISVHHRLEEALEEVDAVIMLRIQKERLVEPLFPSDREYSRLYGLNPRNVECTRKEALVLHPGPVNRGVELDPRVADGPRSVILDQVESGVAVRMALLYLTAGAVEPGAAASRQADAA
ncbi:MAG: aspartate carbamoyltransferase catalytic subunit [Deltaproteobacteria bacterium]|nr:MAG: aspartate carbamoyltransferase catalytic subunit [Deltaproteobacteria bacterium]